MDELITLLQRHAPDVAEVQGRFLYQFLLQGIFRKMGIPWPEAWETRIEALKPGDLLRITADGTLAGWQEAEPEHFFRLENYRASLKPAEGVRPVGRPPKSGNQETRPRKHDAERVAQAELAYQMHSDGHKWPAIAHAIHVAFNKDDFSYDGADKRASNRVRSKVDRLIYLGRKNAQGQ
jgi:hypothetical protein